MNQINIQGVWRWLVPCVLAVLGGCIGERGDKQISGGTTTPNVGELSALSGTMETVEMSDKQNLIATFGGGCYWCTEAVFQRLDGVENVVSGFMGGHVKNPTYEEVCQKTTGHAEVIQFEYDPEKISYAELLEIFWLTHDPTTPNRQGNDEGPQYRSVVFYHSDEQKQNAEMYKAKLESVSAFENPIVTEIAAACEFYAAKSKHQDFFNLNPSHGYCSYVIRPKVEKFEKVFADKLKKKP